MANKIFSKPLKSFSVVFFPLKQRYGVIPSNLINGEKTCCFWYGPKTKNPSILIKSADSSPKDDWKDYGMKFIKSYG